MSAWEALDFWVWVLFQGSLVAAQATGSPTDFPKTKEAYVNWGDMDDDGNSSGRFKGPLEPFTQPLVEQK